MNKLLLFIIIALLWCPGASAKSLCGKRYKGVWIECTPQPHKYMAKEYWYSAEEIGTRCKEYINEIKYDARPDLYCNTKDPSWCVPVYMSHECHQMSGGMLTIDGTGYGPPDGFVYRRKDGKRFK